MASRVAVRRSMRHAPMAWNVVIAGGGFGGLYAARTLERVLPPHSARITLVNDVNFMLYTPLLPGAAAGTLEPRHVVVPLREELRDTDLRLGTVVGATPDAQLLSRRRCSRATVEELRYDQLIVALGSVSRTLPDPRPRRARDRLQDAARGDRAAQPRCCARSRRPRRSRTPASASAWLTYVFVGAGYAGLEGLAELQDFAADVIELYPRCRTQGVRFILVEARDRVMPEIPRTLADVRHARAARARDRDPHEHARSRRCTERHARALRRRDDPDAHRRVDGRRQAAPGRRRARPAARRAAGGSSSTAPCASQGRDERLGDRRRRRGARPGAQGPSRRPPTAQHAIRQGRRVARNVAAALGSGPRRARSRYRTLGVFVDMGAARGGGAARSASRWRGPPAWFLARTLPPGDDAGHQAQAAPAHRLERRAALRPRHLRARRARPRAAAGRADERRDAARGRRRADRTASPAERFGAGVGERADERPAATRGQEVARCVVRVDERRSSTSTVVSDGDQLGADPRRASGGAGRRPAAAVASMAARRSPCDVRDVVRHRMARRDRARASPSARAGRARRRCAACAAGLTARDSSVRSRIAESERSPLRYLRRAIRALFARASSRVRRSQARAGGRAIADGDVLTHGRRIAPDEIHCVGATATATAACASRPQRPAAASDRHPRRHGEPRPRTVSARRRRTPAEPASPDAACHGARRSCRHGEPARRIERAVELATAAPTPEAARCAPDAL